MRVMLAAILVSTIATSAFAGRPPKTNQATLTQSGNELLYCVSREVGMNVNSARQLSRDRDDLNSRGVSMLAVAAIASCANYYQAMARNMGLTDYEFLQSRTFRLLVAHTEKQINNAFVEADLHAEGNKKAMQVGNDIEAAIIRMKQAEAQERAEAEAMQ